MAARRVVGGLLIALGVLLFATQRAGLGGEVVPLAIGVAFLVAYATTRTYGFLVPGGILTGLGTGIVVGAFGGVSAAPALGLGLGFLAIAAIDYAVRRPAPGFWWPLIPGGIITASALGSIPAARDLAPFVVPAALIVIGLLLILRVRAPERGPTAGEAARPEAQA